MPRPPVLLALLASLLLGCKPDAEPAKTIHAPDPSPGEAQAAWVPNSLQAAPGDEPADTAQAPDAANNPAPLDPLVQGEAALRAAAMAAARPMTLTAAAGGSYISADGKVLLTIPPGALTADATIRFWGRDTDDLPAAAGGAVTGFVVDGDWGRATFRPGARVGFKARVAERFVTAVRKAGRDPAEIGVSRDSKGRPYLMVTAIASEAGIPDVASEAPIGSSTVVELMRLPVNLGLVKRTAVASADPDPAPLSEPGRPLLAPLATGDALVARWPGAPRTAYHGPGYARVRELSDAGVVIRVLDTAAATFVGVPAMATCALSPCNAPPVLSIIEAQRLNAAIDARRQVPEALNRRVRKPTLNCPP